MLTIALGLTLHLFVTLPLVLLAVGRIRPSIHFRNMAEALVMAFSTSSSAATLPLTLMSVENKVGVSNRISSFVLPMGATVNMDGTALYECAGVLFISQVLGIDLTMGQQLIVVLTALLASIGAAAVPSAGLVIIFIVLEAVNLRGPEVEVIVGAMLAIDRPLDMYRTAVNVFSDSCGAAIIARSEGETQVDREIVTG
jgi:Na+/H+-dicarboxylate symporter